MNRRLVALNPNLERRVYMRWCMSQTAEATAAFNLERLSEISWIQSESRRKMRRGIIFRCGVYYANRETFSVCQKPEAREWFEKS